MDILRISTAGSVDDGKSTLIGRLLYDTQSLSKDKIENIKAISAQRGLQDVDLSLITDGLSAEREQGITIDVAHIYFATKNRKYIIADTPGHVEYTRNMITGSSNSHIFIILIDARQGLIEQTKRHLFIASLMQIQEIVIVVNKIDLVNYAEEKFELVKQEIESLKNEFSLNSRNLTYIPISAKLGDNVVSKSSNTPWYNGVTLLQYLESVQVKEAKTDLLRFNVQYVVRPQSDEFHDYRGYAGKIKSGTISLGDELVIQSTGQKSKVKRIHKYKTELLKATAGESVTIELYDDVDISRGDILTLADDRIEGYKNFNSKLCWLDKSELSLQKKYLLQYGSSVIPVKVNQILNQLNFENLKFEETNELIKSNSISSVEIKSASPVFLDSYNENTKNGYFILIDESSNNTVAVGFIF